MEWKLRGYEVIEVGSGAGIADMNRAWPQEDIMEHAERIVKAVNYHDDLVEALKYAEAFCEAVGQGLVATASRDLVSDQIKQALAKTEAL